MNIELELYKTAGLFGIFAAALRIFGTEVYDLQGWHLSNPRYRSQDLETSEGLVGRRRAPSGTVCTHTRMQLKAGSRLSKKKKSSI